MHFIQPQTLHDFAISLILIILSSLNHSLFGRINILGNAKASNKYIVDTISAKIRKFSELINRYMAMIKNTIENTMPNDFGELLLISTVFLISITFYLDVVNIPIYRFIHPFRYHVFWLIIQ